MLNLEHEAKNEPPEMTLKCQSSLSLPTYEEIRVTKAASLKAPHALPGIQLCAPLLSGGKGLFAVIKGSSGGQQQQPSRQPLTC